MTRVAIVQYKHMTRCAIVVYLAHYLFIELSQSIVVIPLGVGFVVGFCISFLITVLMCWGFYILVSRVPYIGYAFGVGASRKRQSKKSCGSAPIMEKCDCSEEKSLDEESDGANHERV